MDLSGMTREQLEAQIDYLDTRCDRLWDMYERYFNLYEELRLFIQSGDDEHF